MCNQTLIKGGAQSDAPSFITILGPTASGKTGLATKVAYHLDAEIISADSRQVYKGMDLGTGKDLDEYVVEGSKIPFHLIDIHPAGFKYNLFNYQHDFHKVYENIISRGKLPLLCGGTGLYIESVLKGYHLPDVPKNQTLRAKLEGKDIETLKEILTSYGPLHNKTDVDSCQRAIRAIEIADFIKAQKEKQPNFTEYPPLNSLIIGTKLDRDIRRKRISIRLDQRLQEGMLQEVQNLLDSGIAPEDLIYYGLEYKFLTLHLIGRLSFEEMHDQLETAIHQFAKRQMTWFRGMERRGLKIHWVDVTMPIEQQVEEVLQLWNNR